MTIGYMISPTIEAIFRMPVDSVLQEIFEERQRQRGREQAARRRIRKALIKALGGKCALCGKRDDLLAGLRLCIDHVEGRDWDVRAISSHARWARYWREFQAGVPLRLLCPSCSSGYHPGKPTR